MTTEITHGTGPGHYVLGTAKAYRGINAARITGDVVAFSTSDSTECAGCAMEDSLGIDGSGIEDGGGLISEFVYWRLAVVGRRITATAILSNRNNGNTTVGSWTLQQ